MRSLSNLLAELDSVGVTIERKGSSLVARNGSALIESQWAEIKENRERLFNRLLAVEEAERCERIVKAVFSSSERLSRKFLGELA